MGVLQDVTARLAVPGLPEWTGLLALLLLLLVGLAYLLMPFGVFGVKGRLDSLEAQLDEIQADLRNLALRLPEGSRRATQEDWVDLPAPRRAVEEPVRATPPVPPPAIWPESGRGTRSEPRLDWPNRR